VVQLGGMMTVVSLGSFMFLMFRRDLQLGRNHDLIDWRKEDKG
jgi:protein SCO1/2